MLEKFEPAVTQEKEIELSKYFIFNNHTVVADFFGDNRELYEQLKKGGSSFPGTSLDFKGEFDADLGEDLSVEKDLASVDPERLTEERATSVAMFFQENPQVSNAFLEYYKHDQKSKMEARQAVEDQEARENFTE